MISAQLTGVNGDVLPLNLSSAADYSVTGKIAGVGFVKPEVSSIVGAGDGEVIRNVRWPAREIDIPLTMFGADESGVHSLMRRLSRALRWRPGMPKPRLTVETANGFWYVDVVLVSPSSLEDVHWSDSSGWLLTFRATDPYWVAASAVNLPVLATAGGSTFLPLLVELHVSASQVLGSMLVENSGDVPSPVTWIIHGPFTDATFTRNDGQSFVLGSIDASTTITIDTALKSVVDQAGDNQYGLLGSAPKLFDLPGGTSTVQIEVTGATSDTTVTGFYRPRIEVMF